MWMRVLDVERRSWDGCMGDGWRIRSESERRVIGKKAVGKVASAVVMMMVDEIEIDVSRTDSKVVGISIEVDAILIVEAVQVRNRDRITRHLQFLASSFVTGSVMLEQKGMEC